MKKILLTGFLVFGFLFIGVYVNAMGTSYVDVTYSKAIVPTLQYTKTLHHGVKGLNVLALQRKLKEFGFYKKKLDADYGSGTATAVKMFQRAKGLKDDGIAGPKTFAMILATDSMSGNNNQKICSKEYSPVCATLTITKDIHSTIKKTYSNKCMAKLYHANVLYSGKCQTIKPINVIGHNYVTTEGVSGLTSKSANLQGFVSIPNAEFPGIAFFVWGKDHDLIRSVDSGIYGTAYADIREQGDDLQKQYVDNVFTGSRRIQLNIDDLDSGEGFYYRACVTYALNDAYSKTICGDVGRFETLSGDNTNEQCLEIKNSNIKNKNLSVGDKNKTISEFTIKNNCSEPIKVHHLGFNIISSYATSQFGNIKVFVGNNSSNLGNISVNSSSYFNGDHLGFDYNFSDTNQLETIRPHHGNKIIVRADIDGLNPFNSGSNFFSAFSVGLIDANYTLVDGSHYHYDSPDVYGSVVIVDHNN